MTRLQPPQTLRTAPAPLPDDAAALATLRIALGALAVARQQAHPAAMRQALADLAGCHTLLHDHAGAELLLQDALRWARAAGGVDSVVDLLCALCEAAARSADAHDGHLHDTVHAPWADGAADERLARDDARDRARAHAFEASALAGTVADSGWEVQVLLRISDVLDRCGDRDDAVLLQTRALRLMSGAAQGRPDPALLPGLGRLADV